MIVLFMVMPFITGCVNRMCQPFFQDVLFCCFNHSFWPCCCGFLTFPCLWEISFSSQMNIELSVGY